MMKYAMDVKVKPVLPQVTSEKLCGSKNIAEKTIQREANVNETARWLGHCGNMITYEIMIWIYKKRSVIILLYGIWEISIIGITRYTQNVMNIK